MSNRDMGAKGGARDTAGPEGPDFVMLQRGDPNVHQAHG